MYGAAMQETMLNEVFTGGLSSYSIVNMVMTHLLCMGFQLPELPGPVGNGPGFWGSLVPAPEFPEEDVGELLLSFFDHFGSSFNYVLNAVSVGQVSHPLNCACPVAIIAHHATMSFRKELPEPSLNHSIGAHASLSCAALRC